MRDDDLNPEDMTELEGIFAQMIEDNEIGFVMEFIISRLAAKELSEAWTNAQDGDIHALYLCLNEYGKIMNEIRYALEEEY